MINKKILDLNEITSYLSEDYTIKSSNIYETIPLNRCVVVGKKLFLNSNGKVVISGGVSHVEVSAKLILVGNSIINGGKNFVIQKNNEIIDRSWYFFESKHNDNIILPSRIISVNEGDVISIAYYGTKNELIAGSEIFTNLTVKTID